MSTTYLFINKIKGGTECGIMNLSQIFLAFGGMEDRSIAFTGFFFFPPISSFIACHNLKKSFSSYVGRVSFLIQPGLCVGSTSGTTKPKSC